MTTAMIADLGTEPEVRAFPSGWNGKEQRNITFEWPVGTNANGHEVCVRLYCFHTRGRYVASLNNSVHQDHGVWCEAPMSALRTAAEACSRYSKRNFEVFAHRALAGLREQADSEPVAAFRRGEHGVDR